MAYDSANHGASMVRIKEKWALGYRERDPKCYPNTTTITAEII
jgi:hypothetical protein